MAPPGTSPSSVILWKLQKYPRLCGLDFRNNELFELCLFFMVFWLPHGGAVTCPSTCFPMLLVSFFIELGAKYEIFLPPMQTSEDRVGFEQYRWQCFGASCIFTWTLLAQSLVLTGDLTTHRCCRNHHRYLNNTSYWYNKGQGFYFIQDLPKKGQGYKQPKEALANPVWDPWLRPLDCAVKEQRDIVGQTGADSQTELDSSSRLSSSPRQWGG